MQKSVFFKSVINSDSIFESIGQLGDFAKTFIGCGHVCVFLEDEKHRNPPASYSVNINQAELTQLQHIAMATQFFSLVPEGTSLSVENTANEMKTFLSMTQFRTIYGFHIQYGSSYGALVFGFRSGIRLSDDQLKMCGVIKVHMEQLVEKIQFRKQILKQKTYENLFNTLRMKDSFTVNHCYNVAFYSALLGAKAGVNKADLEQLKVAALLHDIGKIAIPDPILMKPGQLTNEEFNVIRQHPVVGYEMLKELPEVKPLLPVVRWHHERMDGRGYPDRLCGDSIPLWVRIVSLADAFDAMTSTRVYRHSLHVPEVRAQLLIHSGSQFDENLVRLFLDIIDEHTKMHSG